MASCCFGNDYVNEGQIIAEISQGKKGNSTLSQPCTEGETGTEVT
jgi:hypothetical protein